MGGGGGGLIERGGLIEDLRYNKISNSIFPFISALAHSGTVRHNVSVDLLICTVISAAFFSRDQGKKILIIYFTIWLFYLKSATPSCSTKPYSNKMPSQIFSFRDKTLYFWYFTIWIVVNAPPTLHGIPLWSTVHNPRRIVLHKALICM